MKTFTLVLAVLGAGTLASVVGQEIDLLIPHTVTQCKTVATDNGFDSTTVCLDVEVHGHAG